MAGTSPAMTGGGSVRKLGHDGRREHADADGAEARGILKRRSTPAHPRGMHSIRINDQWRIVFRWTVAGPEEVEITDYH